MLYGPQRSQWSNSNKTVVLELFKGKANLVCLAKGHTGHKSLHALLLWCQVKLETLAAEQETGTERLELCRTEIV